MHGSMMGSLFDRRAQKVRRHSPREPSARDGDGRRWVSERDEMKCQRVLRFSFVQLTMKEGWTLLASEMVSSTLSCMSLYVEIHHTRAVVV
jgi:hypothetical protein